MTTMTATMMMVVVVVVMLDKMSWGEGLAVTIVVTLHDFATYASYSS
jgi:hypothetical protein